MLTREQIKSNFDLDWRIIEAKLEHEKYVIDLALEKAMFEKNNPAFPKDKLDLMFIPVCAPRQVCGIRYIDGDI